LIAIIYSHDPVAKPIDKRVQKNNSYLKSY
jgi:hypothetical protein